MSTDRQEMSFEEAFCQLEELTTQLEKGGLPLEEMLALYEKGMGLAQQCLVLLEKAELRVRKLAPAGDYPQESAEQPPEEGETLPF